MKWSEILLTNFFLKFVGNDVKLFDIARQCVVDVITGYLEKSGIFGGFVSECRILILRGGKFGQTFLVLFYSFALLNWFLLSIHTCLYLHGDGVGDGLGSKLA